MKIKRMTALFVAFLILLQSAVFAKSETVYFMLDRHGNPTKTIVVNSFEGSNKDIIDYGVYERIENLSSSVKPTIEGDKIIFKSERDDSVFYYRGELKDAEIPWDIEIKYFLDGKEVNPETLVEAKGAFEMRIRVLSPKVNRFNDRYTVQMQGTFLSGISEISVENASMVAIGSQYTVASIFIPGQEHTVSVKAKIDGLEIGAFTYTGVRAILDADFDFRTIEKQIDGLADASAQVLAGIVRLENGAVTLREGVVGFAGGVTALNADTETLLKANAELAKALSELGKGADALPGGTEKLLASLKEFQGKLSAIRESATQMAAAPDPNLATFAQVILGQIQLNEALIEALTEVNRGETALAQGISEINKNFALVSDGQAKFFGGLKILAGKAETLTYGANSFSGGFTELIDGQKEFVAGVGAAQAKFKEAVSFIDGTGKGNPGSFVSDKNQTESVTFVMRTEELRKPLPVREPLAPIPKKSLLQKFMNLFGLE